MRDEPYHAMEEFTKREILGNIWAAMPSNQLLDNISEREIYRTV